MYFNVQIIQCVLFHFCFVNSFRNSTELNNIYRNTLKDHDGFLVSKNYKSHDRFNDMPERTWITTCKSVTKELRKNEGYVELYVDYRATSNYTGRRCTEILVWVPEVSENVKQVACYCFIRPSILALDQPHEYNQYNRKIMIYPINVKKLMVFEENKDQRNFYVLEIYDNRHWVAYIPVDVTISTTPLPQSYGEVSNLKTILDPVFDYLHLYRSKQIDVIRRRDGFFILCQIVLHRTRYFSRNVFSFKDNVPKKRQEVIVVLRTGNSEPKVTITKAYDCNGFIPNSETIITNYKIAHGPMQDSVLVLTETNCSSGVSYSLIRFRTIELICYEVVELIEYLSAEYANIYY